ncbi:hypothetical protein MBM_09176 [Drepanopeziza brunnea f. sp. 'multigermtubi' MB_m1]|uniref:Uncharacterized protein n=1 Tax=Marssonina brunnea f. sp. multigermtubi (strain MB_m1) TaxID=1072389 RepID=K1WK65_MARBU|nr:uncharacterized protein MBM_09176 [Drepanopeziza brunnea f. sp. 'multigermtubi' MB_m1]EKD12607.1 hypothetical protein MBM_09176 [Drepanopeziza brunnea f. sp. 'multigermtubi' MB_m1]
MKEYKEYEKKKERSSLAHIRFKNDLLEELEFEAAINVVGNLEREVPSFEVAVGVSASFVLIELAKRGLVVKSFQAPIPSGPEGVAVNYLKRRKAAEGVVKERQLGEVHYKEELAPIVLVVAHEGTEALLQVLVIDFGLTVSLKVCGGAKDMVDIKLGEASSVDGLMTRDRDCLLKEAVDYYKNVIVAVFVFIKATKIYSDVLLRARKDRERLEQARFLIAKH